MRSLNEKSNIAIYRICIMLLNISYILSSNQIIRYSFWSFLENAMIIIAVLFVLLKIVTTKIQTGDDRKQYLLFTTFAIVISIVSFLCSGGPTVMKLFLFAFAIRDVPRECILKTYISSLLIGILLVMSLSITGVLSIQEKRSVFVFGFLNPNNLPVFYSGLVIAYNTYKADELKKSTILWELLGTFVLYFMTTSRTATFVSVFVLLSLLLLKWFNERLVSRCLRAWSRIGFWLFALASLFVATQFEISIGKWMKLNTLLSWRPYLYHRYIEQYGISIFGNRIDKASFGTLDNAYLVLFIQYGILTLVLYGIVFTVMANRACKKKDMMATIHIIGFDIFFLFEFVPLLININVILLEFLTVFLNGEENNEAIRKIDS